MCMFRYKLGYDGSIKYKSGNYFVACCKTQHIEESFPQCSCRNTSSVLHRDKSKRRQMFLQEHSLMFRSVRAPPVLRGTFQPLTPHISCLSPCRYDALRHKCSCWNTSHRIQPAISRRLRHSVPVGTLDLFCTQFTCLHNTSSLN